MQVFEKYEFCLSPFCSNGNEMMVTYVMRTRCPHHIGTCTYIVQLDILEEIHSLPSPSIPVAIDS